MSSVVAQASLLDASFLSVTIARTTDELQRVTPAWLDMLDRGATGHNVFNDPRMVSFKLQRCPDLVPIIILMWHEGVLVCVAPFYVQPARFAFELSVWQSFSFSVRKLRMFGESVILAQDIDPNPCVSAIGEFLKKSSLSSDFLWIYGMNHSDCFWRAAMQDNALSRCSEWAFVAMQKAKNHQLLLKDTFDEYVASLGSSSRRSLRYDQRKMFRDGTCRIERLTEPDEVSLLARWIDQVRSDSWQAKTFGGVRENDAARRKLLEQVAAEGWLRSYVLLHGDEPVAFDIGYQYRGVYYSQEVAFCQKHSAASPGSVLTFCVLEDLHSDGFVKVFDFGFGDMPYKRSFCNVEHDASIVYFVPSNRWRFVLKLQIMLNSWYDLVRAGLLRLKVDRYVRKFIKRKN